MQARSPAKKAKGIRAVIVIVLVGCAYGIWRQWSLQSFPVYDRQNSSERAQESQLKNMQQGENSTKCPAGYYCRYGFPKKCTPGHYCPAGSDSMKNCPPGTFHNIYGATSEAECQPCPPGYYCRAGDSGPTGRCAEGFYCIGNSPDEKPSDGYRGDACPVGHFCPQGSHMPTPCPIGTYCLKESGLPRYCAAGYYCPLGAPYPIPCPIGTYLAAVGSSSREKCTQCPPGLVCSKPGLTGPNGFCRTGFYCTGGATTGTPYNSSQGGLCKPGTYCLVGSSQPIQCPEGTFQNNAGKSCCYDCPRGRTCSGGLITG